MIKKCECVNDYLDKLYGYGMRVFNYCNKGSKARCTTCGKEVQLSVVEIKPEKKGTTK